MNLEKIRAFAKWLVSKSVKDVQLFLRFINFYWEFIQKNSHIVAPLTDITRKKQEFHWDKKVQIAFKELKK